MRKVLLLVSALLVLLYLTGTSVYAQGKGHGRGPSVSQGSGANAEHGNTDHGNAGKTREEHRAERESRVGVEDRLERNPALKTKVEGLLPPGTNLHDAAMGFKNEGQFIAALHVSRNLNIPFDHLKAKMTGPNALSLGKSIHELRPDLSPEKANEEAKKARRQASQTEKTKTTS
jgi:hypothetical protein